VELDEAERIVLRPQSRRHLPRIVGEVARAPLATALEHAHASRRLAGSARSKPSATAPPPFRGKMLDALERAHAAGKIDLGDVDLRALRTKRLVVYAKRPFGGPEHVVRYLGRYTHRVGISNERFVSMDDAGVTFRTRDGKSVTLSGQEVLARFVQHVLPRGFVKIRHYGLHAARCATTRLEHARQLLGPAVARDERRGDNDLALDWQALLLRLSGIDLRTCPVCHQLSLTRKPLPAPLSRAPPEAA
jgi:hypothetical protein